MTKRYWLQKASIRDSLSEWVNMHGADNIHDIHKEIIKLRRVFHKNWACRAFDYELGMQCLQRDYSVDDYEYHAGDTYRQAYFQSSKSRTYYFKKFNAKYATLPVTTILLETMPILDETRFYREIDGVIAAKGGSIEQVKNIVTEFPSLFYWR